MDAATEDAYIDRIFVLEQEKAQVKALFKEAAQVIAQLVVRLEAAEQSRRVVQLQSSLMEGK